MEGLSFDAAVAYPRFALDAAFQVGPRETVALVGVNGSGKTTCLHLIAGLLRPGRAKITLGERILCDTGAGVDVPPEKRGVGLLFQDGALFPHLSVEANVRYGARRKASAREWLGRLGIADLAAERVGHLSGGQRQRVGLARALASEPATLLLDEPLSPLDVKTRAAVRRELREFLASVEMPTVVVTHDPVDAFAFGQRVVVMEEGRVTQVGTRDELLRGPRSAFVAALAGLNLIRARLEAGSGLRLARAGALELHVLTGAPAGDVFVSFRPSDVALSLVRPEGSPQNVFAAAVRDVVPLADRVRVVLDAGEALLADVTREATASLGVTPGRSLWATVKATAMDVYE
ncbi:MAG: ABC transporter ATP-binding protein [bacterium]